MELNPSYLEENGRKVFAVFSMEQFEQIQNHIEDLEDLLLLNEAIAKEGNAPTISHEEVRKRLNLVP